MQVLIWYLIHSMGVDEPDENSGLEPFGALRPVLVAGQVGPCLVMGMCIVGRDCRVRLQPGSVLPGIKVDNDMVD